VARATWQHSACWPPTAVRGGTDWRCITCWPPRDRRRLPPRRWWNGLPHATPTHRRGVRWRNGGRRWAPAVLDLLQRNPAEKKLVFVHHRETLTHLADVLAKAGIAFSRFEGSLSGPANIRAFHARILPSARIARAHEVSVGLPAALVGIMPLPPK
jgi:hypothetical protein